MKLPGCGELYSFERMLGLGEYDIELSGGVGTAEDAVGDDEWERDAGARLGETLKGLLSGVLNIGCPNIGAV